MPRFKFVKNALIYCIVLFNFNISSATAQEISVPAEDENTAATDVGDQFRINVAVNEVRLDVVVLDDRGRPVTDLMADDFEMKDGGWKIKSAAYIDHQAAAGEWGAASQKNIANFSAAPLVEKDVGRSIVFIVYSMDLLEPHLHQTKMAIKGFIENQMLPGDMVAITSIGYGNSDVNRFSSDKRFLSARVDAIHHWGFSTRPDANLIGEAASVYLAIRSLKDMPGRKHIFMITPSPSVYPGTAAEIANIKKYGIDANSVTINVNSNATNYLRIADEATRAGVVIHILDIRGLDDEKFEAISYEMRTNPNPLPALTGGLLLSLNNFFTNGIGYVANNMIAGYYMVTLTPPPHIFTRTGGKVSYYDVQLKVKRRGANVITRDGFWRREVIEPKSTASADTLRDALFSPFQHKGLSVNMAAGYVRDAKAGYLIRSWIHVDPKDALVETDEGARIDLEVLIMTETVGKSNTRMGDFSDSRRVKFALYDIKKPEQIAWIKKHGIRFTLLLPVKKPAAYTVRVAVLDSESGKIGSAWQFLELNEHKKNEVALSSIFMITNEGDIAWMNADATKELSQAIFVPVIQDEDIRTPALRTYLPGDNLQTMTVLYNADTKALARSEIEMQTILYRNGEEFQIGESKPVVLPAGYSGTTGIIPILQRLTLGDGQPPGDYIMQLIVTDKDGRKAGKKGGGLFSKIINAYVGDAPEIKKDGKGTATQTLTYSVDEQTILQE